MEENIAAAPLELTAEDSGEIDAGAASITVQGERYPKALQRLVGR